MTLRVSEVYQSVQGEGPRVGLPTVFVRFGGCNLRCPGWPCDTQHAIDPAFRHEWTKLDVLDVTDRIVDVAGSSTTNICFTGGEPFLQRGIDLERLTQELTEKGFTTFEAFTNGTLEYPEWVFEWVHLIMDWKLPGSGEDYANEMRLKNLEHFSEGDAVKFVCADEKDLDVAQDLWEEYLADRPYIETFYGVAWGKMENQDLVELVLKRNLPWRLNVQVHNHIWNREQRGI
jgi:7-carboxy-7-deazaguanine synthase